MPAADALAALESAAGGLSEREAQRRLAAYGPNALRSHSVRAWTRPRPPAAQSAAVPAARGRDGVGLHSASGADAVIIGVIVSLSVGLGFVNEYRSEQAVEALHSQIRHTALVGPRRRPAARRRRRRWCPATSWSCRSATSSPPTSACSTTIELECDEAVLTGESVPVEKTAEPAATASRSCALMGTIVREGCGPRRRRAHRHADRVRPDRRRARRAAGARPRSRSGSGSSRSSSCASPACSRSSIFVINLAAAPAVPRRAAVLARDRDRPHAAAAARDRDGEPLDRLAPPRAQRKVLVKRLVSIEDLGNITLLFTDKTGTLTEGQITFDRAVDAAGGDDADGRTCSVSSATKPCSTASDAVSGNALDVALWDAADRRDRGRRRARVDAGRDAAVRPRAPAVDGRRRRARTATRWLVVKGEPERVLAAQRRGARRRRARPCPTLYDAGARVIAVGARPRPGVTVRRPTPTKRTSSSSGSSCSSTDPRPTRRCRSRVSPRSASS